MSYKNIHVGDYGWEARLGIVQDSAPVDISGYGVRTFFFVKPDGSEVEKTASFATDGTDGWLTYTVEDGLIDATGPWYVYAQVGAAGSELTSEPVRFNVKRRGK